MIKEETVDLKTEIFWARGKPVAAHHVRAVVVTRDDVELSRTELPAEQLPVEALAAHNVMTEALAQALNRLTELEAENAALRSAA